MISNKMNIFLVLLAAESRVLAILKIEEENHLKI